MPGFVCKGEPFGVHVKTLGLDRINRISWIICGFLPSMPVPPKAEMEGGKFNPTKKYPVYHVNPVRYLAVRPETAEPFRSSSHPSGLMDQPGFGEQLVLS